MRICGDGKILFAQRQEIIKVMRITRTRISHPFLTLAMPASHTQDELSRRNFMIGAAKSFLGVSLLPMLGQTTASGADFVPTRPRAA